MTRKAKNGLTWLMHHYFEFKNAEFSRHYHTEQFRDDVPYDKEHIWMQRKDLVAEPKVCRKRKSLYSDRPRVESGG